ncbi:hypothetical protein AAC387_Pa12g0874 [Persea americana]
MILKISTGGRGTVESGGVQRWRNGWTVPEVCFVEGPLALSLTRERSERASSRSSFLRSQHKGEWWSSPVAVSPIANRLNSSAEEKMVSSRRERDSKRERSQGPKFCEEK